jgi:predicted extracellular nuclease
MLPVASSNTLEAVEGMLVVAQQSLYVTEHFQLGRFGQVVVSSGNRLQQPTNVVEPGAPANALQAENDLNRLIVDDAENRQNPDPILLARGGNELTASNTLRGGDAATGTVGVMTYTWAGNSASGNAYRLRPIGALNGHVLFEAGNPRPTAGPDVSGSMTVVSFNVLNYFTTIDTGPDGCGPLLNFDCRGADSEEEFERQRTKLLAALSMLDADVVGLVEVENTPGANPEADIVDGLNDLLGAGTYAAVDAAAVGGGVVGSDAIRVGLIYKPGSVAPLGDPALLVFSTDALGQERSRAAVAQSFIENATGAVFTTAVNHLKSKSGSEIDNSGAICSTDPTYVDCDQGDGQGFFNATRTLHAQELVDWLASDPTGSGDSDALIIGDLNAYAMEDPIDAITDDGYVRLAMPGDYSFVFDGQWGSLDHALASPSLAPQIGGEAEYHINADEPNALDYNTNFKSANQVVILYSPDEYRTSDHDPLVVGLTMGSAFAAAASPDSLWPPNHKLRYVTVTGVDATGASLDVEIVEVRSSEADCCLDADDVPNDINLVDNDTVRLRAERFAKAGRTYTIRVRLSNGNQVVFAETVVTVPHSQRKR